MSDTDKPSSDTDKPSVARELTAAELDAINGGQQVYKHEFPGAVNQMTGLRPFEPSLGAAVADGILPEPTKK